MTTASPFALAEALDHCAKWWWSITNMSKIVGFAIGTASIVFPDKLPAEQFAYFTAAATIVGELCGYRSDAMKGIASAFRQSIDLQNAFGWPVSPVQLTDLLATCPRSVKARAKAATPEPYFASQDEVGPTRAMRNVEESAWWSKQLSRSMVIFCAFVMAIGIVGSIVLLITAIQTAAEAGDRTKIARIVTAFLTLLLSLGVLKLLIGYNGLRKKSDDCEKRAVNLLERGNIAEREALRVMYDYHVARALGPLIPTWIWRLRRDELNEAWKLRHQAKA